jgi:hypothetical protein
VTALVDLRELLAAGRVELHEVLDAMRQRGWSHPQTKRAKQALGVTTIRVGYGVQVVYWELPDDTRCPTCERLWSFDPLDRVVTDRTEWPAPSQPEGASGAESVHADLDVSPLVETRIGPRPRL